MTWLVGWWSTDSRSPDPEEVLCKYKNLDLALLAAKCFRRPEGVVAMQKRKTLR